MEFSKWWVTEFKVVKFPSQGTVFDYYLDSDTKKWMPWSEKVPKFTIDPEMPLQVIEERNHFVVVIMMILVRLFWFTLLRQSDIVISLTY